MYRNYPVLGQALAFQRDPLGLIQSFIDRGEDLPQFQVGPLRMYLPLRADLVYEVLVTLENQLNRSKLTERAAQRFFGAGVALLAGADHRAERKRIQPAFHHKRLQEYVDSIQDLTTNFIDKFEQAPSIALKPALTLLTLQIIAKTMFNREDIDDEDELTQCLLEVEQAVGFEAKTGGLLPDWLPIAQKRSEARASVTIEQMIMSMVKDRRASGQDEGDLLSMLVMAKDADTGESLTDRQVCDEAKTIYLAGHETTSTLLMWCLLLISQRPELEAAILQEYDMVLGDRNATWDDVLPLTDRVLKEILRLYPSAWMYSREPNDQITLNGQTIRAGENIMISPYAIHRQPRYFERPNEFIPERWADGTLEKQLPKGAYIPFGAGTHICIGQHLALMETKIVLSMLLRRWRFQFDDHFDIETALTLVPKGNVTAMISPRVSVLERAVY